MYDLATLLQGQSKRPPLDYGDVCMHPLLLQRLPKRNPTCLPTPLQGPQSRGTHDTPGNSGQLCLDGSLYIGRSFFWIPKVSNIPFFNITPNGQLACARYNSKGQNTNLLSPTGLLFRATDSTWRSRLLNVIIVSSREEAQEVPAAETGGPESGSQSTGKRQVR